MNMATGLEAAKRPYRMTARAAATEATRAKILASTHALILELSYEELTLRRVAAHAGVTFQTVLRHFGTKDGLISAVAESASADEYELRVARPGDPADVAATLCNRYEEIADATTSWEALEDRVEAIAEGIRIAREGHRAWLAAMFAEALAPLSTAERRSVLAQLYVATDINSWRLLRRRLGYSAAETTHVMTALIEGAISRKPTARARTRSKEDPDARTRH